MCTIFFDESGTPEICNIDGNYPIFVLVGIVVKGKDYNEEIKDNFNELKNKYFNNYKVILTSSKIRRCLGDFKIFAENTRLKNSFYEDLGKLLHNLNYLIVSSCILKKQYNNNLLDHFGKIYECCLTFILERVIYYCRDNYIKNIKIIAESRGKNEDKDLQIAYSRTLAKGTGFISNKKFINLFPKKIIFKKKKENVIGLQIADLIAYPIGSKIIGKENRTFHIFRNKFYKNKFGKIKGYGIKIFP